LKLPQKPPIKASPKSTSRRLDLRSYSKYEWVFVAEIFVFEELKNPMDKKKCMCSLLSSKYSNKLSWWTKTYFIKSSLKWFQVFWSINLLSAVKVLVN
jgi:hypothetical protein